MRGTWFAVAAGMLAVGLGTAGLVRAAVPLSSAAHGAPGRLTVTGAYVREPVPPTQIAAGYFTVRNGTDRPDRIVGVSTGAGLSAVLHVMSPGGAMSAMSAGGTVIPAHGTLVLTIGQSHLMISRLVAPLHTGDRVTIDVDFRTAGAIHVVAPVIAVGSPAPTDAAGPSSGRPSGPASDAPSDPSMPGMTGMSAPSSGVHS